MDQDNIIDLVIQKKKYQSYRIISQGRFSASLEIDYKDKEKKSSLLIMTKNELECRKLDFDKIQNQYTIKALQYEYITKLQTYIIHTTAGDCTLQDKIQDKSFRKSPEAIETICHWIRDASLGLKKIHASGYVHLNLHLSTIVITSDNTAKIGDFNFARHSSTQNKRLDIGSGRNYLPPESYSYDTCGIDGEAFDTWCIAMLTIESLTDNYVGRKTKQVTPWPKLYAILHKILQGSKFEKVVKKAYPKSANKEYVEHVLHLLKHTLKFHPQERPKMSEFSLLMMELGFLKYIDKKLTDEQIWIQKVPLNELEVKMLNMALKKKPSCASQKTKNKFGKGFQDQMLFKESYEGENIHYSHPRSQTVSSNREQSIAVENEYNTKQKQVVLPDDAVSNKKFSENVTVKKQHNHIPKKIEKHSNDRMSGDFVSDEFVGESYEAENIHYSHPRSQTVSSNREQSIAVENEYNTKEKHVVLPDDVVSSKRFSENVAMKKQDNHIPKKIEKHSNDRMSGDFVSDEFDGKSEETEEFSFEHTDLYDSQDSTSGKDILKSERIQIFKPDPYEKPLGTKDLQKSTDAEKQISKQEKQSEIFATDIANDNIHISQKQGDLVACKSEKYLNECHKENTSDTSTSKWIFGKMINWALEDIFYAGVMQSGSFISKLSKDLTG